MKVRNKLNYESNVQKIKKNFHDNTVYDGAGIIDPFLLSNQYNPGILDYEPKDEIYLRTIVRSDFEKKGKPLEDLPKDIPKDIRLPVNRNDVISLSNWLDFMIETKMNEENTPDSSIDNRNEELQIIYSACLTEITRQVSVECNERAILLTRVWTSLMKLWETALQKKNEYLDQMQQNYLNEVKRIHQMYEMEIGIVKDKNKKLEDEKANLNESNDILTQNAKFLKNKVKKLEKDMRGAVEKFDKMKKEFKERELYQKQMEMLLQNHDIQYDKDNLYQEGLKEQGNNLEGLGLVYRRNENQEIKYQEADIENNYDLDTLVFGSKAVDTEGLIPMKNDFTEITKDFHFLIDKQTSTKDLITFGEKQVQAKIKKEKKKIEIDDQLLIEQTRRYQAKYLENDSSFMELIEEKFKEKPHLFNKLKNLDKPTSMINQENMEMMSLKDENLDENLRKSSDFMKKESKENNLEKPRSLKEVRKKPIKITLKKPKGSPAKNSRKSFSVNRNLIPFGNLQNIKSGKSGSRKSLDMMGASSKHLDKKIKDMNVKISRHESISEKSERSETDSKRSRSHESVRSTQVVVKNAKKKKNSYSPVKTIIKYENKPMNTRMSPQIGRQAKRQKNFDNFMEFLKNKIFRKKDNDILLTLEILHKLLSGDKLSMIFKENFGKTIKPMIDRFNEMEFQLKDLRKRTEMFEIEKGTLKMQFFEMKNQNGILIEENTQKNSKINMLKNNMDSLSLNMTHMQSEYEKLAKTFHNLLFEEEGKLFTR